MDQLLESGAAITALMASGIFFMSGLLTGVWKYTITLASETAEAPYYVNIAHRASLLYAYAALLVAVFASLSVFPGWLNMIGALAPLTFFAIAILLYIKQGIENTTDNQFRNPPNLAQIKILMAALIIAEIGGFAILLLGTMLRVLQ